MAKRSLNLRGTTGIDYDLDKISSETRDNPNKALVIHVHKYHPRHPVLNKADPTQPAIGQIWLSKLDSSLDPGGNNG